MGNSIALVADYFRVSHVSSATIPNSRLSNILAKMHQGRSLTKHSLDFLQQQNLPELYRLACREITYEAYVAGLDPDYLRMHQVAQSASQAKDAELQALAAHYLAQKSNHSTRKNVRKMDSEAERQLRRKREREATEAVLAAQRTRQAEWKAQRVRNCELAAATYHSRANTPGYCEPTAQDLARYFHLEHIAAAVSAPLSDLLDALYRGRPLTTDELTYLKHSAPSDLYRLAFGQLSLDEYIALAKTVEAEAFARKAREEAAAAARIARERDPEYIKMMQTQALYKKYDVSLTDKSLMPRMTKLLQQIDAGERLPNEDLKWLGTSAKRYFTAPIRTAYHRLEADFHADQYLLTQNPWNAINACGHYRKCKQTEVALRLIDSIAGNRIKQPKVQSAALTTRGGVMRDLGRSSEAIQMGETAHKLMPQDYRPCTLLGAVHMELRNFETGHNWYEEARKRGAPEQGIDSELRSIFQQLDSASREAMKSFLLAEDSHRYSWLKQTRYQETKKRG
ncbi:hypothetical protein [Vogesella indigofera]|uniref:hypothetical protein n=1 Tax=Vogesella indigofera TaxID=45465 RepID=UPI00234D9F9F|nr:hypothetical protein [Vogesella indigofera]MDC7703839.1 hypothetical protein [Vogesella indigofera]